MIYSFEIDEQIILVNERDQLNLGRSLYNQQTSGSAL